jgi:hypothetical protein
MKFHKYKASAILLTICMIFSSCDDLTRLNENPNAPENVSSNFLLTYVITNLGKKVYQEGKDGSKIGATMQYMQSGTNEGAAIINQYAWTAEDWSIYYSILRNNQLILNNGYSTNNRMLQAVGLIMKSYIFGLMSDLYGDIPYLDALKAESGVFIMDYDRQDVVYKGVLTDLKTADQLLAAIEEKDAISATADVLYGGNKEKWKKFANALRLRYALRLHHKKAQMSAIGINIEEEFKDASTKAFTTNADDASFSWIGTSKDNAAPGGPLNAANPNFLLKPGKPFVDKLTSLNDPRLERWTQPVLRKWDAHIKTEITKTITNQFGESYAVIYTPAVAESADTSLYVGLPIGMVLTEMEKYNKGNDSNTYPNERNPYISYIHERYRKNTDPYVNINLMTYSEVAFILAEGAMLGGYGVSDAEAHYKNAIRASMTKAGVFTSSTFDFDAYYAQPAVNYSSATNAQERIMEQKWISNWFGIQSWFDWRRTGYPTLKAGTVAQFGPALPLRYQYPPSYFDSYKLAVDRLESTSFVPSGQSKDHPYSKIWLLEGTGKPW